MPSLNPMFSVTVQLTAEQYDRILALVWLLELDPDKDFTAVAQQVICDSLDRRLEAAILTHGGRGRFV